MHRRFFVLLRRHLLTFSACLPLLSWATARAEDEPAQVALAALEREFNGRLGLCALDPSHGRALRWRADEAFPLCSTFKVVLAAAILKQAGLSGLGRRVRYQQSDLVTYSPVTEQHLAAGMTLAELCAAGLQYSDNTAGNLLLREVGGPAGLTAFARQLGDNSLRLDRWETELNSAIPGDPRDTTTPGAMAATLQTLLLGQGLDARSQAQLTDWLLANTTGDARIRAGVPHGWKVADKTGSGDYGTANDVGIIWPAKDRPVVIALYSTQPAAAAEPRSDVLARMARIVADWVASVS
ncbi:class A beta-lactamase [Pseudomonas sp. DC3000-4b1]|uniref:class A beta-lactamase n=1 Tax=unclassified Pseudomonas TaxID=196821 RepID=UPI003CFA1013